MALPPIPHEEIERLLAGSATEIHRHAAAIALLDNWICSGVYAKSFGYEGILTAGHCAKDIMAEERFALCVSEARHQLWVTPAAVEHVPIGWDETESPIPSGPDLSFIIIRDKSLRDIIRSHGIEFYDLDRQNTSEVFGNPVIVSKFNWSVAGNPNEKVRPSKELLHGHSYSMVMITAGVMQANFNSHDFRGDFDYVELLPLRAFGEFPDSYEGVSGGGIWYHRFVVRHGTHYHVEPTLAGIACWQSIEHIVKRGCEVRKITGHGWASIYEHVPRVLAEHRTRENHTRIKLLGILKGRLDSIAP